MKHEELTSEILAACFEVINELGVGFLESVYEKALMVALDEKKLSVKNQVPINVRFRKQLVGLFYADIVVNDSVIVELKAVKKLLPEHSAQLINYLKATRCEVGLLINFGNQKLEYRRFINKHNPKSR